MPLRNALKYGLFGQKCRENPQLYVDLGIYSTVKARYRLQEFGLLSREVGFEHQCQKTRVSDL
jgi:hypothetical protein